MSFLLSAIEDRQLLGINPKDKNNLSDYLDYAINTKDSELAQSIQAIVLPSAWVDSWQHKPCLQALFEQYHLIGLIDVGRIWSPVTNISFTLMVLSNNKHEKIVMAEFSDDPVNKKSTDASSTNMTKSGELPDLIYTGLFKCFLLKVEQFLVKKSLQNEVTSIEDKNDERFFFVPFNQFNLSRLQVAFYHPDNQIDLERYKKANFELLEKLAKLKSVRKLKDKGEAKVFSWALVSKTENDKLPVKENEITNYKLNSGDIIVTPNLERLYIVNENLAGCYAPAHSLVLQLSSSKLTPEYLCLYLQSEIAKKYSLRVAIGSVLKRLTVADFKSLPILIPNQNTLSKSAELYSQLQSPETNIDKINQLIAAKEDNGALQDSFLLEELEKLRISKRAKVERLIKGDLKELKVCIDNGLFKASMVISGSILEAVILDWLSETEKNDYYSDETEIRLNDAILLLNKSGEIDRDVLNAAHNIRRMRNLIHPINYLKNQGKVTRRECKKLLDDLNIVIDAYKR
jgi:hypothetical protein